MDWCTCYPVGESFLAILKTHLQMIQPRLNQRRQSFLIQPYSGSDQVCIQPEGVGHGNEPDEIISRQRFATREMDVKHAQLCHILEYPRPGFGRQFLSTDFELQGIGAIDAVQGTAVCHLRDQRKWWWSSHRKSTARRSSRRFRKHPISSSIGRGSDDGCSACIAPRMSAIMRFTVA